MPKITIARRLLAFAVAVVIGLTTSTGLQKLHTAKEMKSLVSNSDQQANVGVKLVDDTGYALARIDNYVSSIDKNIDAISTAAVEQSAVLKQISIAVNELDQMTQQNAAMVEETTALSHTLSAASTHLSALVNSFVLNRRAKVRDDGDGSENAPTRTAA